VTEDQNQDWVNTPQQARSQETLDRFLEAAEHLLKEKAFDEITIAEIVTRADRTVGSFYARFDDKTALLKTLTARRLQTIRQLGDGLLEPTEWQSLPVRELVHTAMRTACELFDSNSHVFRAGLAMAATDADGRLERNRHYDHLAKLMCAALVAHPDVEADAEEDIDRALEMVGAMLDARLIFRQPEDPRDPSEFWRTTAADLTELFLRAAGLA